MKILLHKLFGWNYIVFRFGYGEVIHRVKTWPNGVKTVTFYGETAYLDESTKMLSNGIKYVELT